MGFSNHLSKLVASKFVALTLLSSSVSAIALPTLASPDVLGMRRSQPTQIAARGGSTLQTILDLTNQERSSQGLSQVSFNQDLAIAAQQHADDIARSGNFSHTGSDGSAFDERIRATGYDFYTASENIYMQAPRNRPERVVAGWMRSQGHRDNILNGRFTQVGLGYAEANGRHYYVQVFGTPKGQAQTSQPQPSPIAAAPEQPSTSPAQPSQDSTVNSILQLTNQERGGKGLGSLSFSDKLNAAAQRHANDMARSGKFSHTGSDGSSMGDRIKASGYRLRMAGENIAYRAPENDPAGALQSWMKSKGHRENILNGQFTEIGIGYATDGNRHYYVQVFGRPR